MTRHRVLCAALLAAFILTALSGCSDPLVRAKETFAASATTAAFDEARLDALARATQEVTNRRDRYGDEGAAQAELMLAYGYVSAGKFDDAAVLVRVVELSVDMTKVSPSVRALLVIVKADMEHEKAVSLAAQDVVGNRDAVESRLRAAADAYEQARTSASFASEPVLRQLLALRETDVLISGGNLRAQWDTAGAAESYSRVVQVAAEASLLDDAMRKELVERAVHADRLLKGRPAQGSLGSKP